MIIIANYLALNSKKDDITGRWCFSYDEDSIFRQLKDGLSSDIDVVYVGSLKVNVDKSEQDNVSQFLAEFNSFPTFIPSEIQKKFYDGFCKNYLWPLFHYMFHMYQSYCNGFDGSLWQAYVSANKIFANKIMEVFNPKDDYVWIHDYHLMVLPTFLRKRCCYVRLGFFFHSSFPSSKISIDILVGTKILKSMLNAVIIGFQTFDYACHFLSVCSRILGLEYESKRGQIWIEYFGRTIFIKILPAGIHMGRIQSTLYHLSDFNKVREVSKQFKRQKLIIGFDDLDMFKGVSLKLLAFERLFIRCPTLQGKLVLLQIKNPPRSDAWYVEKAKEQASTISKGINEMFGFLGYKPVIIIEGFVPFHKKAAYYALAECCIVYAEQDGRIWFHTSTLRAGCSSSLSGAIRVNHWDINVVVEALKLAITMSNEEKQCRHEKNCQFVSSHDLLYWAQHFDQGLVFSCKDHGKKLCWGFGFGLEVRVLSLSPNLKKLSRNYIVYAYKRKKCRAIFLDYDVTIVPHDPIVASPSPEVVYVLNKLCSNVNNTVIIVIDRGMPSLINFYYQCENLGIAVKHGGDIRLVF
ncbi:putative alpha,alpha-trehalose-phosphate synthase (UDP-forming) [Medicago truncatula]|uniref:Putative alpha,alpha-trehalose-phosphate synthase (UDP-forming) n=1 Tax=Medicago truncatula TaxID=3880 RepID=A0A072UY30_MEDTR|nr:trehalose-6-phosphate synthase [Medicago truncatula]RHN67866.1 putative alpha,alpha-trehalose-phosphate synthase (UDP-forming) [Medicago truncatula]